MKEPHSALKLYAHTPGHHGCWHELDLHLKKVAERARVFVASARSGG
jgi:hypothetical protein